MAVNPTGKGNLQAFPVSAGTGAWLSVNYSTIDTNLVNAGTVGTVTGADPDITVASNFSSATRSWMYWDTTIYHLIIIMHDKPQCCINNMAKE